MEDDLTTSRAQRAEAIARHGGVIAALDAGALPQHLEITVAEAVILGLLVQDVRTFIGIFGHGSTDLGEAMRVYEAAGLLRTHAVRNEVEAAHAATALRWSTGQKSAVFTSIGPGALQAMAGSLAAASDGIGVWHVYADETTEAEGENMQQLPRGEQEQFLRLTSTMGPSYSLHTPWALPEALRRGLNAVDDPHRGQPFFLLLPINVQPQTFALNLRALPTAAPPRLGAAAGSYEETARLLLASPRVVVKAGAGALESGPEIAELLDLVDGFLVTTPRASGLLPYEHPRNCGIGGSKGSISGNYAMEHAELLVNVGARPVCQSDMSRTGYPRVRRVVNINTDVSAVTHYNLTTALRGDAAATLRELIGAVRRLGTGTHRDGLPQPLESEWAHECAAARRAWREHARVRYENETLFDPVWGREVLTQPAAIHLVTRWAREHDAVSFFDAGDVQANGFQIVEDERPGQSITETGASYMGFASSALLATGIADRPFYGVALTGDGSFSMNPQILIDGVEHRSRGAIVLFDNRRQGAISSLQRDQYGVDYATNDRVEVDYVAWAEAVGGVRGISGGTSLAQLEAALDEAREHDGLSLIHVPVYFGDDPLGGMGAFGRWNVGNNVAETQALRHGTDI